MWEPVFSTRSSNSTVGASRDGKCRCYWRISSSVCWLNKFSFSLTYIVGSIEIRSSGRWISQAYSPLRRSDFYRAYNVREKLNLWSQHTEVIFNNTYTYRPCWLRRSSSKSACWKLVPRPFSFPSSAILNYYADYHCILLLILPFPVPRSSFSVPLPYF